MKSILISIKPKWVAKILNGEKTIEIRKTMPKCDLPIDVYIYCTKSKSETKKDIPFSSYTNAVISNSQAKWKGKVVAKFTLNRVEEIDSEYFEFYCKMNANFHTMTLTQKELLKKSCLSYKELDNYVDNNGIDTIGYVWHISNLVIFDKPKELNEFKTLKKEYRFNGFRNEGYETVKPLIKAPQSYMFVEVE